MGEAGGCSKDLEFRFLATFFNEQLGQAVVFLWLCNLSCFVAPSDAASGFRHPSHPPPGFVCFFFPAAMDFPQHSKQVLEQLNQQRQLGLLCDCTFVVDGIDFKAHKAVLAACSEYFRMLFVDQKDVVHLDISNAAGRQGVISYPSQLLKRSDLVPQGSSACNLVHFGAF